METCGVEGCEKLRRARGWCHMHYMRWRTHGDVNYQRPKGRRPCVVDGCAKPRERKGGYCTTHGARVDRHGSPDVLLPQKRGADHPRWRGGRYIDGNGYIRITDPITGQRRFEHHWVMMKTLGRNLLPGENVHHKNGVRDDNRAENLELWITLQPHGQRPEDLVEWAHEIIRRYG